MNHGSLFSGIGGFDLAAQWMGWENKFHCEWNPFGQKVLKHYWPNAASYNDITKSDFTIHRGQIDILTGGFPCQPYSAAGKRLGKEDDRHLWPEMLRVIREVQPRWIVGENVRGLTNWNGGLVFDEVQSEMESEGYEVTPFLLPACAVNAPHRRDRIWFIAYACGNGYESGKFREDRCKTEKGERFQEEWKWVWSDYWGIGESEFITDSSSQGLRISPCREQRGVQRETETFQRGKPSGVYSKATRWEQFPTESPVCSGHDGVSARLDGIAFSKWRNESIKAAGNAIVPQVAYQIFQAIRQYELLQSQLVLN